MPRRPRTASTLNLQRLAATSGRQSSETPSLEGTRASSPSTSTGTAGSAAPTAYQFQELPGVQRPEWAHLPHDVRFYLAYFTENITHYHYGMLTDSVDFFRTTLPAIAVQNEALLYALAGFAAYHFTLKNPKGRIQDFLQYYNKSVTLLLSFLKRKERHNTGTLLTILQLATIEVSSFRNFLCVEALTSFQFFISAFYSQYLIHKRQEYLGDWVNLMGHQRAAYEVITLLYTPETGVETATSRMTLTWYMRFDVFLGLMGGFATSMPCPWFLALIGYFHSQSVREPTNVACKLGEYAARLRFVARQMTVLFGKHSASEVSDEDFAKEHARLSRSLEALKESWEPTLSDPAYLVRDLRAPSEPDPVVVDVSAAGVLYEGPLFPGTLLTCEWHTIVIVHKCLAIGRGPHAPPPGGGGGGGDGDEDDRNDRDDRSTTLAIHANAISRIVEAMDLWPSRPKGSLIMTQACLTIAAPFLPQDGKHHQWIRRKFASFESVG